MQVGIGVKTREELAGLIFKVALYGVERAEVGGVGGLPFGVLRHPRLLLAAAKAPVEQVEGKIGYVRHLARLGKANGRSAVSRTVVVAVVPMRIKRDCAPSHDIERQRLRVRRLAGGDHDGAIHLARMGRDPFYHLNAAEAAADKPSKVRYAKLPEQRAVDLYGIADRKARERASVRLAGRGVY